MDTNIILHLVRLQPDKNHICRGPFVLFAEKE